MTRISGVFAAVVLALVGGAAVACAHDAPSVRPSATRVHHANPFANGPAYLVRDPDAVAATRAATGADKRVLTRFTAVPTGVWLTPEAYPAGKVGPLVRSIVGRADAARRTPLFVIYGIPDRDCVSGESAGGAASAAGYRAWVREIAAAADRWTAVVLEPDALASAGKCGLTQDRERLLASAVRLLVARNVSVYLDAGHANWTDPGAMATMLARSGIAQARGFAVNTSYFDATSVEQAYAAKLRTLLGTSAHYVLDTGRNGAGANGEFCNPPGRALGATPHLVARGGLDAALWVKPPGESDGYCHGGPAAGRWWTQGALRLAHDAGW